MIIIITLNRRSGGQDLARLIFAADLLVANFKSSECVNHREQIRSDALASEFNNNSDAKELGCKKPLNN